LKENPGFPSIQEPLKQLHAVREYCNEQLKQVSITYHCTVNEYDDLFTSHSAKYNMNGEKKKQIVWTTLKVYLSKKNLNLIRLVNNSNLKLLFLLKRRHPNLGGSLDLVEPRNLNRRQRPRRIKNQKSKQNIKEIKYFFL